MEPITVGTVFIVERGVKGFRDPASVLAERRVYVVRVGWHEGFAVVRALDVSVDESLPHDERRQIALALTKEYFVSRAWLGPSGE